MSGNENDARNALAPLRPPEADLAFRDDLTGLYNFRLLSNLLEERWDELAQACGSLALMIIDLDLFKQVNDRYGHLSGDDVLRVTASLLETHFRKGDMIFRYGGDEFVVLLPGATLHEAQRLGERARESVQAQEFFTPEERRRIDVPLSFSIGIASWPDEGISGRALLARADERLYAQKKALNERLRTKRRLTLGIAGGTATLALLAVLVMLARRSPDAIVTPPPQTTARLSDRNDEQLRLEIALLQAKIADLTREREQQTEAEQAESAAEIRRLQEQLGELGSRLASPAPPPQASPQTEPAAAPLEARTVSVTPPAPATPTVVPPDEAPAPEVRVPPLVPPRLLVPVVPRYPLEARRRRIEATIVLRVLVDERGRVVRAEQTERPKGYGLDGAAHAAAIASRWEPATRGGIAVPMETNLRVEFRMRE